MKSLLVSLGRMYRAYPTRVARQGFPKPGEVVEWPKGSGRVWTVVESGDFFFIKLEARP